MAGGGGPTPCGPRPASATHLPGPCPSSYKATTCEFDTDQTFTEIFYENYTQGGRKPCTAPRMRYDPARMSFNKYPKPSTAWYDVPTSPGHPYTDPEWDEYLSSCPGFSSLGSVNPRVSGLFNPNAVRLLPLPSRDAGCPWEHARPPPPGGQGRGGTQGAAQVP